MIKWFSTQFALDMLRRLSETRLTQLKYEHTLSYEQLNVEVDEFLLDEARTASTPSRS